MAKIFFLVGLIQFALSAQEFDSRPSANLDYYYSDKNDSSELEIHITIKNTTSEKWVVNLNSWIAIQKTDLLGDSPAFWSDHIFNMFYIYPDSLSANYFPRPEYYIGYFVECHSLKLLKTGETFHFLLRSKNKDLIRKIFSDNFGAGLMTKMVPYDSISTIASIEKHPELYFNSNALIIPNIPFTIGLDGTPPILMHSFWRQCEEFHMLGERFFTLLYTLKEPG